MTNIKIIEKDNWLTPPEIIQALGNDFDLDPCASINRPWGTAKNHYTVLDDGLKQNWDGKVWCFPPFGSSTRPWLEKCATLDNAIALLYAATDTKMFKEVVWSKAHAVLFLVKRIRFYHPDGTRAPFNCGFPMVLVAYGAENAETLLKSGIQGQFFWLNR